MIDIEMVLNVAIPGEDCVALPSGHYCDCKTEVWQHRFKADHVPREDDVIDLWESLGEPDFGDEAVMPVVDVVGWNSTLTEARIVLVSMSTDDDLPDRWREALVHEGWSLQVDEVAQ